MTLNKYINFQQNVINIEQNSTNSNDVIMQDTRKKEHVFIER